MRTPSYEAMNDSLFTPKIKVCPRNCGLSPKERERQLFGKKYCFCGQMFELIERMFLSWL